MLQIIKDVKKARSVQDLEEIFSDYEFYHYTESDATNDYIDICFRDSAGQKYSVECKNGVITILRLNKVKDLEGFKMEAIKI